MRRRARQAGAELALLSLFGAASGATNGKGGVLLGLHNRIVNRVAKKKWSVLTIFKAAFVP
jgi:hypothetical protein